MNDALQAYATALWQARCGGPVTDALPDLTLADAYRVADHNHRRRVQQGDPAVGRKIGHTNPANWPTQGIEGPSWGWLYQSSSWQHPTAPSSALWREPKVELELVLRLRGTPADLASATDAGDWAHCIDAIALGLEFVDRPYPGWANSVPDSVAAGGVHAGLVIGPWQPWPADGALACTRLNAFLAVHHSTQHGGSAGVMGSPLHALAALQATLKAQQAPLLQAGEWITTGALAPALPWQSGQSIAAQIDDGAGLRLSLRG